jgi:hypothetical protein
MNLPSYAGGMDLWGPHKTEEETNIPGQQQGEEIESSTSTPSTPPSSSSTTSTSTYLKPMIDDQVLEIVGIAGCLHMGSIQVNLTNAIKIAQVS